MSLIQEINRTNTEKNKTKQVAINIDNKLVELGGEQAINLADVPNKMEVMVNTQYIKFAKISGPFKKSISIPDNQVSTYTITIPLNIDFIPNYIEFTLTYGYSGSSGKHKATRNIAVTRGEFTSDILVTDEGKMELYNFNITALKCTFKANIFTNESRITEGFIETKNIMCAKLP